MGTPMEGFFDGADVVFGTTVLAILAIAQGVLVEASIPFSEPVPIDEGTHTERVNEATPISTEMLTPQEGAIPLAITQTKVASPATPLVISTNDPFVALSQVVKDGSSLVVTPSYIPTSATRGLDVDLSFEGSEDVLEDPDDEPTIKKKISDSDEDENVYSETKLMGMCLFPSFFC